MSKALIVEWKVSYGAISTYHDAKMGTCRASVATDRLETRWWVVRGNRKVDGHSAANVDAAKEAAIRCMGMNQ